MTWISYLSVMRVNYYYIILVLFVCSCSLTSKIDSGFEAYERKQYAVAVTMLTDEYEHTNDERIKAEMAYFLGMSYTYLNNTKSSKDWFSKSVSHNYGPSAVRELAFTYKKLGNYQRAVDVLEKLNSGSKNKDINREIYVLKEIMKWEKDVLSNTEVSLSKLSSPYSDYSPTFLNNQYVVFTSDRGDQENTYKWTGNGFSNLFISANDGSDITLFDALINTSANEGTAVFSQDGTEIIFTRCISHDIEDDYCHLYSSTFTDGKWLAPQRLGFQLENINYGHPALIEGDSVLIYSADIESGFGGKDLYYSERLLDPDSNYYWSESYIMPQTINTSGNEVFPTTHGDSLFYSSDFLAGLGGYDIFLTVLKNGSWSPPINLKRPINSSEDDFGIVINPLLSNNNITKGYFTSSRGGLGNEDIFSFETITSIDDDESDDTDSDEIVEEKVSRSIYIAVKVVQPFYSNDMVGGEIVDYTPVNNAQVNIDNQDFYTSDKNGIIIYEGELDKKYKITGKRKDYLTDVAHLSTYDIDFLGKDNITLNVRLILHPVIRNQEIVLDNIYYDYDKWNIREEAKPTLDTLAMMLKNNPQISIELSSHTDCRGERDYNLILSQRRAQSAVDYIASKGINNKRLRAKGYGENKLIIECVCEKCSEEEHQKNRRTTFTILD